jgi:hypothetical protein
LFIEPLLNIIKDETFNISFTVFNKNISIS